MPHKDPEAKRAYSRAYYEANRDKLLIQQKAYKSAHPDEQRQSNHARYQTHRDVVLTKQRIYREKHHEEIIKRNAASRAKNREQIKERKRQDYHANHDTRRLQANQRRAKNPERYIAQARSFYATHKEEINTQRVDRLRNDPLYREEVNVRQRANYAKRMAKLIKQGTKTLKQYRQKQNEKARAWRKANPGKEVNKVERRRARKLEAPLITLSDAQWVEIQVAYKHRCVYCGKRCKGSLTQDHITPVGPEGAHHLHNIVPACLSCNARKQRKAPPIPVQPLLLTLAPEDKKRQTF